MGVLRDGKWGVDRRIYNESAYPTYCAGCAFTLTMDVARALHRISYHVPFFWVDDAYITGFLPALIGNVTHVQIRSTYEYHPKGFMEKFMGPKWWGYTFCADVHQLAEIEIVWHWVVSRHKKMELENKELPNIILIDKIKNASLYV